MNVKYFLFLWLLPLVMQAQQQGNFWHFGNKVAVDFSSGVPVVLTDSEQSTVEGCASYSDEEGNLLFYTNGGGRNPLISGESSGKIWNRNNEVMYDMGFEEGGGFSARQSSIIIPKPNATDQYYLFTMEENEFNEGGSVPSQPEGRGLSYFEIDMNLNGGLGGVTLANQNVYLPLFESLSGTIHANGEDYWIVCSNNNNGNLQFVAVLVNETGVQVPSFVEFPINEMAGTLVKISPNSRWIFSGRRLFEFDNSSGSITGTNFIANELTIFGTSFSPNSRYLYLLAGNSPDDDIAVIQYDIEATDIASSANVIGLVNDGVGSIALPGCLQIAPDGNLYYLEIPEADSSRVLSAIYCPNSSFPVLEKNVVQLITPPNEQATLAFRGLPNFTDHLFAQEDNPLIVDIGPDTLLVCPGANVTLDAGNPGSDYTWSTGETTQTITVNTSGTYFVDVTNSCEMVSDQVVVILSNNPLSVTINGPTLICDDEVVQLIAEATNADSYMWSTGDTIAQIQTVFPGLYSVTVTGGCSGTETQTATIAIQASNSPQINIEGGNGEGLFCIGDTALLSAQGLGFDSILWSTGETAEQIVVDSGLVTLAAFNTCGASLDSIIVDYIDCDTMECLVLAPNIFTPNGDDVNDTFGPVNTCGEDALLNYNMKIYNRWGNLVFESNESMMEWDGNQDGKPAVTEAYFYLIQYSSPTGPPSVRREVKTIKGNVTLAR